MRRRHLHRLTIVVLAAMTLPVACDAHGPLSPSEARSLREHRALWERSGSADYTVESRISCFCSPHLNFWTRLTVRGGRVVAADPVETLPVGVTPLITGWLTVGHLFERASVHDDVTRDVVLRFDKALGYPLEVTVSCLPNVTDCGVTYAMRNLTIP